MRAKGRMQQPLHGPPVDLSAAVGTLLGTWVATNLCPCPGPSRHIFENRKYVEDYRMDDIQRELGLDRDGLIHMALLLGSDYTEGVQGIGVVNALEVPCPASCNSQADDGMY